MLWQSVDLDFALGAPRNLCFVFTLLLMKTVVLWEMKTNQAGGYVIIGVRSFRRASKVKRHHHSEIILRYVQKAPDDIRWEIDKK